MSYDAVLFDHDGVLVDVLSRTQLYERFSEQSRNRLREVGVDPTGSVFETLYLSVSFEEVTALASQFDTEPSRIWRIREDVIEQLLTAAVRNGEKEPYDDVEVVETLSRPTGIVSNNQTRIVEDVMSYHGIDSQFETVRARDPRLSSLTRKKPEPTFITEAMNDLGVSNPLSVGDSESDVIAGQRADVDVAFVRREHNRTVELSVTPTYEIETLATLSSIVGSIDSSESR